MQPVQGVLQRIAAIQARASAPPIPGQFRAILDAQLQRDVSVVTVPDEPVDGATAPATPSDSSTLGGMTGTASVPLPAADAIGVLDAAALDRYMADEGITARNGWLSETDLVPVSGGWGGRNARLLPPAAVAWEGMRSAALEHGVDLQVTDSYRTWQSQDRAHQAHLRGEKTANVLPAGQSEHGNGLAVDVTNGHIIGREDAGWQWLQQYAAVFGWHPISNETWHWEFRGI